MLTQQCTNQCACTEIPPSSSSVLFREAVRTENMKLFNASISASRIAVKWLFGDVYNYFKFLDYKKNLKIGMSSVGKMYVVCANFKERLKFLIWQPDCRIFSTRATHFGGILCLNISCFHSPLMTL